MTAPATPAVGARPLWNRSFTLWFLGGAQSTLGSAAARVTLAFLTVHQTGSVRALGINIVLALLPSLFAPLVGTAVDRLPLRFTLILSDLLRGGLMVALAAVAARGEVPLPWLHGLSFALGLIGVWYGCATSAALPALVDEPHLARASGLLGTAAQGANLAGAALGGLAVAKFGSPITLLLDGASYLVMAAALSLVAFPASARSERPAPFMADVKSGLALVAQSRWLTVVPVIGFSLSAATAPLELLIPKRMLDLGYGAAGQGLFSATIITGSLAGNALIAALGARMRPGRLVAPGLLGMATAMLGLAVAMPLSAYFALAALLGFSVPFMNVSLALLILERVPRSHLGRVFGLLNAASQLGTPVALAFPSPIRCRFGSGSLWLAAR